MCKNDFDTVQDIPIWDINSDEPVTERDWEIFIHEIRAMRERREREFDRRKRNFTRQET